MAKLLILYYSRSGNTRQMAELVAEGARRVSSTEIRTLSTEEASLEDLRWCDGIAAGSPTYVGVMAAEMKSWWDTVAIKAWGKIDGKIGCAFASAGGTGGGSELTCMSLLTVLMNFGFLVFGVPDYAAKKQTLHYGAVSAGAPKDKGVKESCRILGERLAQWVRLRCYGDTKAHPRE